MEPFRQHRDAFHVAGLTVRTTNLEENTPATARLGSLWNRFFDEQVYASTPHRNGDTRIYGVYSAYESDAFGAFDVTAGVAVSSGEDCVAIEAGDYLVFDGQGEMPHMVIATWQRIWQYFEAHPEVARRYRSDFEAYEGPDKVAIHIGVA
jgi:predicted transcriptional regulator YdeE